MSSELEQLEETLKKLTTFKSYFIENEKVAKLASWIYEETGIPKPAARIAIKYIAPLVLAQLAKAGNEIGSAWLLRLHERLQKYTIYFRLTQSILEVLLAKTNTLNNLDIGLKSPTLDNLEVLLKDEKQWEALQTYEKGFIQLLIGQSHLSESQDFIQSQIRSVLDQLTFNLELKTLELFEQSTKNARTGSAHWLTYASRQATLVGRDKDLEKINSFINQNIIFSWWVVTGDGGIGKSRLGLETLHQIPNYWDKGFLPIDVLRDSDALKFWKPSSPTFIVIDYAAAYPEHIARWIDRINRRTDDYDFPIRLLILERDTKNQPWWEQLLPKTTEGLERKGTLYTGKVHRLKRLSRQWQNKVLHNFLRTVNADIELPDVDNTFWESLDRLSDYGRPLFIGMVAVAIAEHGVESIRNWNQEELLEYVLGHEQQQWERILINEERDFREKVYDLLAIATFAGGINWNSDDADMISKALIENSIVSDEKELERLWVKVKTITSNDTGDIQPDIFSEFFLLQHWKIEQSQLNKSKQTQLCTAAQISAEDCIVYIFRITMDYPEILDWKVWLNWLHTCKSTISAEDFATFYFSLTSMKLNKDEVLPLTLLKFAIFCAEDLLDKNPTNSEILETLASTYMNASVHYANQKEWEEFALITKKLDFLSKENSKNENIQLRCAEGIMNAIFHYSITNKNDFKLKENWHKLKKLASCNPYNNDIQFQLSKGILNLIGFYGNQEEWESMEDMWELLQKVVKKFPENEDFQIVLARGGFNRVETYGANKLHKEMLDAWRTLQVIADKFPMNNKVQLELAKGSNNFLNHCYFNKFETQEMESVWKKLLSISNQNLDDEEIQIRFARGVLNMSFHYSKYQNWNGMLNVWNILKETAKPFKNNEEMQSVIAQIVPVLINDHGSKKYWKQKKQLFGKEVVKEIWHELQSIYDRYPDNNVIRIEFLRGVNNYIYLLNDKEFLDETWGKVKYLAKKYPNDEELQFWVGRICGNMIKIYLLSLQLWKLKSVINVLISSNYIDSDSIFEAYKKIKKYG